MSKEQKKRQKNITLVVIGIFILLLTISYRNSQINEKFTEVQTLKKELSSLEKENQQLEVTIQNSLNLNNIEKQAKEKLGMQKLTNKQTVYVTLPKKDYVEPATEELVKTQETVSYTHLDVYKRQGPIPVGFAFKRPYEGGHGNQSHD